MLYIRKLTTFQNLKILTVFWNLNFFDETFWKNLIFFNNLTKPARSQTETISYFSVPIKINQINKFWWIITKAINCSQCSRKHWLTSRNHELKYESDEDGPISASDKSFNLMLHECENPRLILMPIHLCYFGGWKLKWYWKV